MIAQLHLEDRVTLYGRAAPHEVVALLKAAQLVVIPSRDETFGIVALEAMAAEKPVLATRVGGLPELVSNKGPYSWLVPPTVDDLTKGLNRFLPTIAAGTASAASVDPTVDRFAWQCVVDRYEDVLRGATP